MFLRAQKIEVSGGEEHGDLSSAWNGSSNSAVSCKIEVIALTVAFLNYL